MMPPIEAHGRVFQYEIIGLIAISMLQKEFWLQAIQTLQKTRPHTLFASGPPTRPYVPQANHTMGPPVPPRPFANGAVCSRSNFNPLPNTPTKCSLFTNVGIWITSLVGSAAEPGSNRANSGHASTSSPI